MSREVMKLALEALERNVQHKYPLEQHKAIQLGQEAIATLREALAQPEQEPVAWHTEDHLTDRSATTYSKDMVYRWQSKGWPVTPLYTSPPQLQPEEPLEYWNAVEGWVKVDEVRKHFDSVGCGTIYKAAGEDRVPLFTSPPQRQPLTDEEIKEIFQAHSGYGGDDFRKFARAIESAHGIGYKT